MIVPIMVLRRLVARRGDLHLLAEAMGWLGLAWMAMRLLPFSTRVAFFQPRLKAVRPPDPRAEAARVGWAIQAVSRRVPWRSVCFDRGIAAQRMLCHRGIAADLHYGVAKVKDGQVDAHVWVTADGMTVVGGDAGDFTRLATFSGRSPRSNLN